MKLAMLTSSDLDNDPRLQKEALAAARAGHDVEVFCRTFSGGPDAMPYRVSPLSVARQTWKPLKYVERLRFNAALARAVIRAQPDVIHTANVDTLVAACTAARVTHAKLVYDAYELWSGYSSEPTSVHARLMKLIESVGARRADCVVTVNDKLGERMAAALTIEKPLTVMNTPFTVDVGELAPGAWRDRFGDRRVVIYQGRYAAGRDIAVAIRCVPHLPEDVVVAFRGYGVIEDELRREVRERQLEDRVHFLEPVAMSELVTSLVGADLGLVLYAATNENNTLASPNKLFEYIMAGVPCIASELPVLQEIIERHGVGTTFRSEDERALAEAIIACLEPEAHARLRASCFAARDILNWETEATKLLDAYTRLVDSPLRGAPARV